MVYGMKGANRQTQKRPLVVLLRVAGRIGNAPAVPASTSSKRGCVRVPASAIPNLFDRRVVMISFLIISRDLLKAGTSPSPSVVRPASQ